MQDVVTAEAAWIGFLRILAPSVLDVASVRKRIWSNGGSSSTCLESVRAGPDVRSLADRPSAVVAEIIAISSISSKKARPVRVIG